MKKILVYLFALCSVCSCYCQGFVNLNFEQVTIRTNGLFSPLIHGYAAMPGWSFYSNGEKSTNASIVYNTIPLGSAAICLESTNNGVGYQPVQGSFFALIGGDQSFGNPLRTNSVAISQTGLIPLNSRTLIFWGTIGGMQISFNDQLLNFIALGVVGGYDIMGADITPYAGQIGELLFRAPYNTSGIIDNIQFSTTAIPEPSALALLGLGAAIFRWGKLRKKF